MYCLCTRIAMIIRKGGEFLLQWVSANRSSIARSSLAKTRPGPLRAWLCNHALQRCTQAVTINYANKSLCSRSVHNPCGELFCYSLYFLAPGRNASRRWAAEWTNNGRGPWISLLGQPETKPPREKRIVSVKLYSHECVKQLSISPRKLCWGFFYLLLFYSTFSTRNEYHTRGRMIDPCNSSILQLSNSQVLQFFNFSILKIFNS